MRAFIELSVAGNRRAIVDTSLIVGVVTTAGCDKHTMATATSPVTLLLRNAEPLEIVGMEPVMIFAEMIMVAEKMVELKEAGDPRPLVVRWLDRDGDGSGDGDG